MSLLPLLGDKNRFSAQFLMIIFLYGEDTYRLSENRESVITSYKAKHGSGFNFFRIDGAEQGAASRLEEALKSASLFSEVKLILLSNIFALPDAEYARKLLSAHGVPSDRQIVLLATHQGGTAKPKELFDLLTDKSNLVRNFAPLDGAKLQSWLKKESQDRGVVFAPGALQRFALVGGTDSWARVHNLTKLANYAQGAPVTLATINLLIATETEPNVFEFIDALGSGRKTQAFSLLFGELAYGRDPYYLLSMVTYQVRNMLIVKDFADRNMSQAQIAQKSGVHPFVVKKMLAAIARMSLADIKRFYQEVLDLEQGTKQGRRDLEDGLFGLALS